MVTQPRTVNWENISIILRHLNSRQTYCTDLPCNLNSQTRCRYRLQSSSSAALERRAREHVASISPVSDVPPQQNLRKKRATRIDRGLIFLWSTSLRLPCAVPSKSSSFFMPRLLGFLRKYSLQQLVGSGLRLRRDPRFSGRWCHFVPRV